MLKVDELRPDTVERSVPSRRQSEMRPPRDPFFGKWSKRMLAFGIALAVAVAAIVGVLYYGKKLLFGTGHAVAKAVEAKPSTKVLTDEMVVGALQGEGALMVYKRHYTNLQVNKDIKYGIIPAWMAKAHGEISVNGWVHYFSNFEGLTFGETSVSQNGQTIAVHSPTLPYVDPTTTQVDKVPAYDDSCGPVQEVVDFFAGDLWDCHGPSEEELRQIGLVQLTGKGKSDKVAVLEAKTRAALLWRDFLYKFSSAQEGYTVPTVLIVHWPDGTVTQSGSLPVSVPDPAASSRPAPSAGS